MPRRAVAALAFLAAALLGAPLRAAAPRAWAPPAAAPAPTSIMRAEWASLDVHLDPPTHAIEARATLSLVRVDDAPDAPAAFEVVLSLHPDLAIQSIEAIAPEGAVATGFREVPPPAPKEKAEPAPDDAAHANAKEDDEPKFEPRRWAISVEGVPAGASLILGVQYRGALFQDIAAGEQPGAIHNFAMRAHVGDEGIYLSENGCWHPIPDDGSDADGEGGAPPSTTRFELLVDPVPGMALVAGAPVDGDRYADTGKLAWKSSYPVDGLVLVGGPHEVHSRRIDGLAGPIVLHAHLKPEQAPMAEGLLDAVAKIFARYEALAGPYPDAEYRVVDNFFSSGFAFPGFTLLSSAVIDMGERAWTSHGYLDHELLHCWWGNGVFVDYRDGNWCEALPTYAANHLGHALDGDADGARRVRRNYVHFLSRMTPERDKPLGTFGRKEGAGRSIGYDKGAMFFHMLAREIGDDAFWNAMRSFDESFRGRHANWDDLRAAFEKESGRDLAPFFERWVRQPGMPSAKIASATARKSGDGFSVEVVVEADEPLAPLGAIPLRIALADGGALDVALRADSADATEARATFAAPSEPVSVELDPDYDLLRKVGPSEWIPTTAATRSGKRFASVAPALAEGEELAASYADLRADFEESFEEEEDDKVALTAGVVDADALGDRCVLLLGDVVRDEAVAAFLASLEFPVSFLDGGGFAFEGVEYRDANQAILATVRHPGVEGGGVTVFYGNTADALPSARIVPFYANSVVVFVDGKAAVKQDLESPARVAVTAE